MRLSFWLCFVSTLSSAVVSVALTGETLGQNTGGRFGFGGPLGAANGLGPPALRGGIGGGVGGPGGGGGVLGGGGTIGPVVVAPPGTASGTLNGAAASGPGAGTPMGPGSSSLSGASTPYAFTSGGRMRLRVVAVRNQGKSRLRRRRNSNGWTSRSLQ
jgi:hypothetical protein